MNEEELKKTALAKPDQTKNNTNLAGISQGTRENLSYYGQGYQESANVGNAKKYLQSVIDNKPGEYKSKYDNQLNTLYEQIMGREPFKYNVNDDPVYQQYKNQYQMLGQQAMQDTVGNAAALTGGYGNSWAATAGSQAYQQYLQSINDVIPDLYSQAYARYAQEGQDLRNNMALTQGLRDTEYGEYRDSVGDWYNDRDFANSFYDSEYARDYNNWASMLNYYQQLAAQENASHWNDQANQLAWEQFRFQQQQYEDAQKNKGGGGSDKKEKTNPLDLYALGAYLGSKMADFAKDAVSGIGSWFKDASTSNSGNDSGNQNSTLVPGSKEYDDYETELAKEYKKLFE